MAQTYNVPEMISSEVSSLSHQIMLKLITGEGVLKLLKDPIFLKAWDSLYAACPWGTVFQSRLFVKSWYEIYAPEYNPIIVTAYQGPDLVGLLPCAHHKKNKVIVGAGLGTAEYQTWLAIPAFGEAFIKEALETIMKALPGYHINLYNVPPGSPMEWTETDTYWKQRSIVKLFKRPLMDLNDPEVFRLFRKKQFREKTNRLKRLGNLKFEKITEESQFNSIIDELVIQSDFRKGAKFNLHQFELDRFAKDFLMKLFSCGILHTTVLSLDGQTLSSIAAIYDKKWVHLAGLNTHTPLLAKHSPGLINFIMLGQLLQDEGMHFFDLTPGGDAYKERLATTHDYVYELCIATPATIAKRKFFEAPVINFIKAIAKANKQSPRQLKFEAVKIKDRLIKAARNGGLTHLSRKYILKGETKKWQVYKMQLTPIDSTIIVKANHIADLLLYKAERGIHTRWDFLADAMSRFEIGQQLYTIRGENSLICCAWKSENNNLAGSEDGITLTGIHCDYQAAHNIKLFLSSIATLIKESNGLDTYQLVVEFDVRAQYLQEHLNK